MAESGRFNTIVSTLAALISAASVAVGIYVSIQQNDLRRRQDEFSRDLDSARQRLAAQIEDRTRSENRQRFYLEVEEKLLRPALIERNLARQKVALAFVQSLEDSELRRAFLALLQSDQARPEVQEIAERVVAQETRFEADTRGRAQQRLQPAGDAAPADPAAPTAAAPESGRTRLSVPGDPKGWDFDIFYCERSGNEGFNQAAAAMRAIDGALPDHGLIRVRLLPDSINQQPGYRVGGYVVRREESAAERGKAAELRRALDRRIAGAVFREESSGQATPFYISVFICPGVYAAAN